MMDNQDYSRHTKLNFKVKRDNEIWKASHALDVYGGSWSYANGRYLKNFYSGFCVFCLAKGDIF